MEIVPLFYSKLPNHIVMKIYDELIYCKQLSNNLKHDLLVYHYIYILINQYRYRYPFLTWDGEYKLFLDLCMFFKLPNRVIKLEDINVINVWKSLSTNDRESFYNTVNNMDDFFLI